MWARNVLLVSVLLIFGGVPMDADDSVTGKQMDDILAELQKIRILLENNASPRPANGQPTRITLDLKDAPFLGSKDAQATMVEFMDFQCPYCKQFHDQTFPALKKLYIDTGKVRFYVMDLPLDIHPTAPLAAQAGRCAGEQGKYWVMYDVMETERDVLDSEKLAVLATKSGLHPEEFRKCLSSGKYKELIQLV